MNTKNASRTKKDDVKSGSCLTTNMNDVFQLPPVLHNQIQIVRTSESCFKDYSILGSLGKGTYAQVWKVKHKLTNEIYAAKLLQPSQFPKESFNRIVEMFTKEIINLSICQCPGVVKLHKVIGGKEGWVLIQDFVNDGTLWKENLTNSMEEAFLYFIQLFQGMCYIQDMNIVHRDLKPTNILKQDNKKIVIADFGWSEHVDSCNLHPSEWPGTLEINPPEVLRNTGPMTEKIDNYALGMNMILFVSGRFVCRQKGVECSKVAQTILRTVHNLRHSKPPSKFRDNLKAWDLFVKLTSSNPSERISLEKVLYHPWVTEMLNNLSIQNSKFIWYEKVKSRWIFLLSNNWNFFKSMSTQTSKSTKQLQTENMDLSKKNNENKRVNNVDNSAVIKTRSEDRENGHKVDTATVDVTKETQKNVEANKANKDEYDIYATQKNCKNKNEEFSLDKNEKRSIEKERKTRHPISIAATDQEKEQNKERERTKEVVAKPVNHENAVKDTFKQECENITRNKNEERKCNCETANINVGNVMGKLQKQEIKEINAEEEEEEEDEEYEEEDDDDDENDDDDDDDDDDEDDDDEEDDDEDEEDDDDDDDDEEEEEEDEEDEVEEEKDVEYKNKLRTKDKKNELGVTENAKDSKTYHYNDRKELNHILQKNTTVSVAKEEKNCSNKIIDNAFMNFVETKNLNISKDLMKNDLLEKINKLAERTLEENRRKNEGSQQTDEQKNMFNSSRKHDNYIKRLTRNFQANKVKTPQFFGGNMMNGRNSKDMSLLFGRPKNQKNIASEFKNRNGMDEIKEDPYSQNEEAIRNRLKVSVDGIYPNVNFKNSFENLDLHLKKEMEKMDKLYKNTKEIGNDKIFSCQREHITTPGNELNVDHLSEMEKFINNEKIGNTGRFEIENNEGDIEASPDVYENIIEKCLKKTNDKAFSKYGTLLEKKKINKTNTLVHKLFNRNVELMFDERNDERERTTTVPLEQYRVSMKCNSENVQRDEDGYNDVSDKNGTNGNKYNTNISKEFSLDAELDESTDQCRFPHNKTKEKNNSLIYSSKRTLHPTYATDIFENNQVSNRQNAYNDDTGSNNTVTNERIYKTELPYGKNDSLSKQDKETVKTLTHLSNEYNNNYCDKSKVSSSTINSNGSSDANNSIIDNFVNNTKTEKTESVYHSGYFDASRDNSSTEDKKLHTFLCKSKMTHKANVDTAKTQEFLMEDISDCNTAWDLNRKSNALGKLKSYDQSSVDSAKITNKDRKKSEDKKKNTYIANQTEEKTFMNGKDKSNNLIFKSSDKKTYEEMLLEELSRKLQNKSITKTPSNEKIKQMEVHENKSLHHQLLNNPQYQKLINTYSEESSSALVNKLKSQEYTTNMYNNHIRNTNYGNEKSSAYQYINGQVSNANSYTKSTLYLNDNSKENVGKTFSASTFECSDFDIHYSSNKELIESFNSDYNFVSKDKYLFESKKKQQNNFVQLK